MSDIDNAIGSEADMWNVQMPTGEVYTVTVDQLDDAFQRGLIDENTLVMQAGMDGWATLGEVLGGASDDSGEGTPAGEGAEEPAPGAYAYADEPTEYASDRISAELGLAAPPAHASEASDPTDDVFDRIMAREASPQEEPTQREMALARPGGTTLLNYPPPPMPAEAFSAVAPVVQDAATLGVAAPPPIAAAPAPVFERPVPPPAEAAPYSRPVPPAQAAPYSRPVPPPVEAAPYSRPVPPPAEAAPYARPVPPPAQAAPYSRPVPPPVEAAPYSRPAQGAPYSRPVPPPAGAPYSRPVPPPAGAPQPRPGTAAASYPPPAFGGIYPPPVISSAPPPSRSSEPPGFAGPKSTPPVAYEVGDIDIPAPQFRSRGRGALLAVAASLALVGGAVGLSRMDGSSLQFFPQSSAPAAAAAPKPYTPPPSKPAPKPEPAPEPVVAKPEPVAPKTPDASEAKLADDMKQALRGAKVKPAKAKPQARATMRPNVRKASKGRSGSGALGRGGDTHDPLNGNL